jgi:hypothetical protein
MNSNNKKTHLQPCDAHSSSGQSSCPAPKEESHSSSGQSSCPAPKEEMDCEKEEMDYEKVVYQNKKPRLKKTEHKSGRYKKAASLKQAVFDLFCENDMTSADALSFVHSLEKELGYTPKGTIDLAAAIEQQYNAMNQSEKRSLIKLLSHDNGGGGGRLNDEVLECLPFMRKRSDKYLQQPERKERSDKIDLSFISDFMHDYCRYDLCCFCNML